MKTKITREEYDRILATELSSDVAPGTPGHIDDHELIAQKIAYSGSLSVGNFYKMGDDRWSHFYMGETAGISDTGPYTTDETLRNIDSFSSEGKYFLVFPTEESISDLSSIPANIYDQSRIEVRVFNSKSFDNLFSFLHHYVGYSLKDTLSFLNEIVGFVEALYDQVGELDTKVSTLESDNSTLNSTVSTLEGNVTTLTSDKEVLEGQVSTLESTIGDLTARLEALENPTNSE